MRKLTAGSKNVALTLLVAGAVVACRMTSSSLNSAGPTETVTTAPLQTARCQAYVPPSLAAVQATTQDAFSNVILRQANPTETCLLPGGDLLKGMEAMLGGAGCKAKRIYVSEDTPYTATPTRSRSVDLWHCPDRVSPDIAQKLAAKPKNSKLDGSIAITMVGGPDPNFEIIAWDRLNQRHLFWASRTGPNGETFVLDGSSFQMATPAETASNYPSSHPCTRCHENGALLMKELPFPWSNWVPGQIGAAGALQHLNDHFHFDGLTARTDLQAQEFETIVRSSKNAVASERTQLLRVDPAAGGLGGTLKDALRPLLCDSEVQLSSAAAALPPAGAVTLPTDLVLAPDLVNALQVDVTGLVSVDAVNWSAYFTAQNLAVGATIGTPAQASSPWGAAPFLMPVRAQADVALGTALIHGNVIESNVATAALMVDFPNAMFSSQRCGLLAALPDQPLASLASPADVTAAVSAAMTQAAQGGNQAAAAFVAFLTAKPSDLKARVQAYYGKCTDQANASRITASADDLYKLIRARNQIIAGPTPDLVFTVQRLESFNWRMFPEQDLLGQMALLSTTSAGLDEATCGAKEQTTP